MSQPSNPPTADSAALVPIERPRARDLALLAALAAALFLVARGAKDLWAPNEPIYGLAVKEMAQRGDWMIPTINDRVFAEKPILYYWMALVGVKVGGGVDELVLRLPSVVAGVGAALGLFCLVLPYAGRRRAWIASALFVTCYQVFWASRTVQMDVLVLATTVWMILPFTRLLDFEGRRLPLWALAGAMAGVGFLAKGPVALIVPGFAVLGYAVSRRQLGRILRDPGLLLGAAVAVAVASPWYLGLWFSGEKDFLIEVLFRQNFTRFVDAWDHQQPWWYFLKYILVDYVPWSLLLPIAFFVRPKDEGERRLMRWCMLWIVLVVFFFSLSDSKRAPYILPVAPAIAILVAGLVDRIAAGGKTLSVGVRWASAAVFWLFAALFAAAAVIAPQQRSEIPPDLTYLVTPMAVFFALLAAVVAAGQLLALRRPAFAPGSLFVAMTAFYLVAVIWVLPPVDSAKSARTFSTELDQTVEEAGGEVISFGLWQWRASYAYYADRVIPNLEEDEELTTFWSTAPVPFVLAEDRSEDDVRTLLPDAVEIGRRPIGNRTAVLFAKAPRLGVEPRPGLDASPGFGDRLAPPQ